MGLVESDLSSRSSVVILKREGKYLRDSSTPEQLEKERRIGQSIQQFRHAKWEDMCVGTLDLWTWARGKLRVVCCRSEVSDALKRLCDYLCLPARSADHEHFLSFVMGWASFVHDAAAECFGADFSLDLSVRHVRALCDHDALHIAAAVMRRKPSLCKDDPALWASILVKACRETPDLLFECAADWPSTQPYQGYRGRVYLESARRRTSDKLADAVACAELAAWSAPHKDVETLHNRTNHVAYVVELDTIMDATQLCASKLCGLFDLLMKLDADWSPPWPGGRVARYLRQALSLTFHVHTCHVWDEPAVTKARDSALDAVPVLSFLLDHRRRKKKDRTPSRHEAAVQKHMVQDMETVLRGWKRGMPAENLERWMAAFSSADPNYGNIPDSLVDAFVAALPIIPTIHKSVLLSFVRSVTRGTSMAQYVRVLHGLLPYDYCFYYDGCSDGIVYDLCNDIRVGVVSFLVCGAMLGRIAEAAVLEHVLQVSDRYTATAPLQSDVTRNNIGTHRPRRVALVSLYVTCKKHYTSNKPHNKEVSSGAAVEARGLDGGGAATSVDHSGRAETSGGAAAPAETLRCAFGRLSRLAFSTVLAQICPPTLEFNG